MTSSLSQRVTHLEVTHGAVLCPHQLLQHGWVPGQLHGLQTQHSYGFTSTLAAWLGSWPAPWSTNTTQLWININTCSMAGFLAGSIVYKHNTAIDSHQHLQHGWVPGQLHCLQTQHSYRFTPTLAAWLGSWPAPLSTNTTQLWINANTCSMAGFLASSMVYKHNTAMDSHQHLQHGWVPGQLHCLQTQHSYGLTPTLAAWLGSWPAPLSTNTTQLWINANTCSMAGFLANSIVYKHNTAMD